MTNDETIMPKEFSNDLLTNLGIGTFVILSSFGFRHSSFHIQRGAFWLGKLKP